MIRYAKVILLICGLFLSIAAKANSIDELLRQKNDPFHGNPNGNITVVEFFDYECSYCANMITPLASVVRANPNVRVVYKDYPILSDESKLAAQAALAAKMQGKYLQYNHALFRTRLEFSENNLLAIAKSLGLNVSKFKKDMNSPEVIKQIENNSNLASSLNINGTPAFIIAKTNAKNMDNVKFVPNTMSISQLQYAINRAGR